MVERIHDSMLLVSSIVRRRWVCGSKIGRTTKNGLETAPHHHWLDRTGCGGSPLYVRHPPVASPQAGKDGVSQEDRLSRV